MYKNKNRQSKNKQKQHSHVARSSLSSLYYSKLINQ